MTDSLTFAPRWVSPPGDTISDLLGERGWSQAELAARTGYTTKHVNELVQGRAAITPDTAERLSLVLGSTPEFWLVREAQYRAAYDAERAADERLGDAAWLEELPLGFMVKQGWVRRERHKGAQVLACLSYFRVAGVHEWRERYERPLAAYRSSRKHEKRLGAVATWLRGAELASESVSTSPFDKDGFRAALGRLRALSKESSPAVFGPALRTACAEHGVAVVFVPAPPGCPVSGATQFLGADRALLALSLRYKTNDHLWFTFFHEAAHLILHGKRMQFIEGVDGLDAEREEEADRFARDLLIPKAELVRARAARTKADVIALADELGVAPGIVVGRMQHEELIRWNQWNDLKVRFVWAPAKA